jgi:hypothetical protein
VHRQRVGLARAECIAWPFVDLGAFRRAETKCPDPGRQHDLAARLLALGCAESVGDLSRHIWRPDGKDEKLETYLVRISQQLLEPIGRAFRLKPDRDCPGTEILAWRWMSLALPVDLLVAARDPDPASLTNEVNLLDPTLRVLEPTAHLHVHATAAHPFSRVWTALAEDLDLSRVEKAPVGFSDDEWKPWLRRAFAAQWILDVWMKQGRESALALLDREPYLRHSTRDLCAGTCRFGDRVREASLEALVRMREAKRRSRHLALSAKRPPLSGFQSPGPPDLEVEFARRCLAHLLRNPDDNSFRTLWVQRTRIRVILYRHLVHDPSQRGLDAFVARFSRINEYAAARLEDEAPAAVWRESGLQLEAIELRGSPSRLSKLLKERLKSCGNRHVVLDPLRPPTIWVLHFIRDGGKRRDSGAQAVIRRHYRTAQKLVMTLEYEPELLRSVRGIDVASRELSGPLWYLAAPIRHVLDKSRVVASRGRDLQGLHLTIHAGEDFRHLLGGLRSIHEPFWWDLMHRGDRLGHALAIGLDPKRWCEEHPVVVMPRHERMLDLAWLLSFVSTRRLDGVSARTLFGAQEELSRRLCEWGVEYKGASEDFLELARNLGRPQIWSRINAPHWTDAHFEGDPVLRLLKRLLAARDCTSSSELVEVSTEGDWRDLLVVRDELARLLSRWRTPIEVNPSSNLLIGGLTHALDQPLFHLDPMSAEDPRGLVLTLSADDPLCFATTLSDEFAYAWAGMVFGAGIPPGHAQEWLERAARAARRAAFDH